MPVGSGLRPLEGRRETTLRSESGREATATPGPEFVIAAIPILPVLSAAKRLTAGRIMRCVCKR